MEDTKDMQKGYHFGFAGAGFSSAVIARELVEALDCRCTLFDTRDHIGGNCFTERDQETQVMVHKYGPHIFHTQSLEVWEYVCRHTEMMPYVNRVKANARGEIFTLPINLHTLNQFFHKTMSPKEAEAFLKTLADPTIRDPKNFEEKALSMLGEDLYRTFFWGYTKKQWGIDPKDIPASVFSRLPIRFDYNDNYYSHPYQGMPKEGYTALIASILDHPRIEVHLKHPLKREDAHQFDHLFWSGPIDGFFKEALGRLSYRTVYWESERVEGDFQGIAVMNYPEIEVPYTRISEHKHFAPWEKHEKSIVFYEYSKETTSGDIPYYPIRKKGDVELLERYKKEALNVKNVTFIGRLGTYRYLDMDQTILEAIETAKAFISTHS